jgi:hypothetical protein
MRGITAALTLAALCLRRVEKTPAVHEDVARKKYYKSLILSHAIKFRHKLSHACVPQSPHHRCTSIRKSRIICRNIGSRAYGKPVQILPEINRAGHTFSKRLRGIAA